MADTGEAGAATEAGGMAVDLAAAAMAVALAAAGMVVGIADTTQGLWRREDLKI